MLQRKQSLYLFIAALLNAGVLYFDLYKYHIITHTVVNGADTTIDTSGQLHVRDHYPSLLITLVMTLLPLVTIFMYSKRSRQIGMSVVSIFAAASFITMSLNRVTRLGAMNPAPTNGSYWLGMILPVVSVIFLLLAILGIRRDDKLVKSADRLR